MRTLDEIKEKLSQIFDARQATVLAEVFVDAYGELVRTGDVDELKAIVHDLAQAQTRTEQRLEELAQAQTRTEQRVEELAQAQTRTEQRLEELAQAQTRTEQRLGQLAQAQMRTEEVLQKLAQEHRETRRQLGGIAMTIGYTLENEAFKALPELLHRHFGLVIQGRLVRRYVNDNRGKAIEVNICGEATKDGVEMVVVGESKSQLSKNDVDNFVRRKLHRLAGVFGEVFPVLITHMATAPDVESYAKQKGIALFYSYDF